MHGPFEGLTDPAKTSAATLDVGRNLRNSGAVAQTDDWRTSRSSQEMFQEFLVITIGGRTDAGSVGMVNLFKHPGCTIQTAPGVTTGGKPIPPIPDVLEISGGQKAFSQIRPIGGAAGFTDDPVRACDNAGGRVAKPGFITCETIMFNQSPQDPAVMLIVAAGFIASGSIEDALLGSEIPPAVPQFLDNEARFRGNPQLPDGNPGDPDPAPSCTIRCRRRRS